MHSAEPAVSPLFTDHYVDMGAKDAETTVAARLGRLGLVTLDGLATRKVVLTTARRLLTVAPHRDGDPDGLTVIHDTGRHQGQPSYEGLGSGELAAHTEGSKLKTPPRLLLNACAQPAESGGVCLLTDGRAVYADLAANDPEALEALSEPTAGLFGGHDGTLAPVFGHPSDGLITLRLRMDRLVAWNPLVTPHIRTLAQTIARHQHPLYLKAGDAYLIDNRRWLHARSAFTGQRRLYRALGAPRFTLPAGFTAPEVLQTQASDCEVA
jgi:hypothetical protein